MKDAVGVRAKTNGQTPEDAVGVPEAEKFKFMFK